MRTYISWISFCLFFFFFKYSLFSFLPFTKTKCFCLRSIFFNLFLLFSINDRRNESCPKAFVRLLDHYSSRIHQKRIVRAFLPVSLHPSFSILTRLNECRTYKYWKDILRLQESLPVIRFIHSLYHITCLPNRIFRWSKS